MFLAVPEFALAENFVQCSGPDCTACDLIDVAEALVFWLASVILIIAAIFIGYGGFKLASSRGSTQLRDEGKNIFVNGLIGIAVTLLAWFLIDSVMKILLGSGPINYGMWHEVPCKRQQTPGIVNQSVDFPEGEFAPGVAGGNFRRPPDSPPGTSPGPPPPKGQFGENSGPGELGSCEVAESGPCSVSSLRDAGFGDLAGQAAQIAGGESGCNPNAESRTDTTTDGRTYSVGTWQINLTVHDLNCNGQNLDCPSAFSAAGTRNQYNVKEYNVVNEGLYNQCVELAKNPECNNAKAAELAQNSGDMGDWACTARKCNVPTSRNHLCPL
jgi:hypothetical protein